MKYKRGWNRAISLLLITIIVAGMGAPYKSNAEVLDESTSINRVKDSDGEVVLTVKMKDGIITIVANAHAATNDIRYETIGLSFTREVVPENNTTKGYPGTNNFTSENVLMFRNGTRTDGEPDKNGIVTSTFIFGVDQVSAALNGETFKNIKKDTPIFMHAIFRTYDSNGTRENNITNWKEIMNAEDWGFATLERFFMYYNMKIEFKPAKQKNTIYYQTETGTKLQDKASLSSEYPGDKVNWSAEPTELTYGKKNYELIGYYVTEKSDSTADKKEEHYLKDPYPLSKIKSGSTAVKLGGMNVYLIYKEKKQPNTLYYEDESGISIKTNKPLADRYIGSFVYWKDEPAVITKSSKKYDLIGFFATNKNDSKNKKRDENYLSSKNTLEDLQSNGIDVVAGGINVHLVYRQRGIPTPTPKITPVPGHPTGTPAPSTTPVPSVTPIEVPETETVAASLDTPESVGNIRADDRGSEKFIVNAGVPTTESLFTEVTTDKYLMGYLLKKQVGIETYAVTVTKNYILKWNGYDNKGKVKSMTETVPVTQVVSIQRAYGYWEILNFDLYQIGSATVTNYALPNGSTTMKPNYSAGYNVPSATTVHSVSKTDHIIIPSEIKNGIKLSSETITGDKRKPSITQEDFTRAADGILPNLKVKNDSLILNGTTVMSAAITETEGSKVNETFLSEFKTEGAKKCNNNILYKPDQVIEDIKKNGTYHSTGVITYTRLNGINSTHTDSMENNIVNLSSVVIHTPVLCNPIVKADNDKYVQLIKPTSAVQLVLDPDSTLNDFTLNISNYGLHTSMQGYFTRDFSHCLRDPDVSYLASGNGVLRNEVRFPFDVYIKQSSGNIFIKQNTWVVLGRSTATFYLPMWVVEGTYTVSCRSIAVNADMTRLDQISEANVNSKLFNYVATDTFKVEVSGRIYGLSIYDFTDYPMWQEAFRIKNSLRLKINELDKYPDGTNKTTYSKNYSYNYTVGTNDQYGNDTTRNVKYTFPLVNGSHPFYTNIGVMKTGYAVRFKLNTIGCMYGSSCSIKIKPTFYYVDANGKNRTAVDIYYEEEINGKNKSLVKMGSTLDRTNVKTMEAGLEKTGIPRTEIEDTIAILKVKLAHFIYARNYIFTFKDIRMYSTFRTFVNKAYTNTIAKSSQFAKIKASGITQDTVMKQMQSWYGSYYLPGIMHAVDPKDVPKGLTVFEYANQIGISYHENFWKKGGYIIVNFDIVTIDSNGKEHLSYVNASNYLNNGNNSMWTMEGAPRSKIDHDNITFNFKAGDFMIYYADKSIQDDYSPGGLY